MATWPCDHNWVDTGRTKNGYKEQRCTECRDTRWVPEQINYFLWVWGKGCLRGLELRGLGSSPSTQIYGLRSLR